MSCRDILPWPPFLWEWALCEGGTALWNQLITCPLIATVCLLSHLKHTYHIHQIYWPFFFCATEPEFSKHFLLLYFSLFDQDTLKQERFLTWLRLLYKTPWCETDSSLHGNRLMTMIFDMSQEWTQCKRASVWLCLNICSFLRTALCVCGQVTVGKKKYTGTDTHVVADISAPKEVEETQNEWLHKEEIRLG